MATARIAVAKASERKLGEPELTLLVHARPPRLFAHLLILMLADFLPPLFYNGRHWRSLFSVEPCHRIETGTLRQTSKSTEGR